MILQMKQRTQFWKIGPLNFFVLLCSSVYMPRIDSVISAFNILFEIIAWFYIFLPLHVVHNSDICVYCEKSKDLSIYCVCSIDTWFLYLYLAIIQHAQTNEP